MPKPNRKKKKDNSDMAKFGYNGNTIRIQRNVYFISGNMQGKYKKLPLNCNELIPKRENFVFGKTS